jgi:DNA sulfur modification protein DndC
LNKLGGLLTKERLSKLVENSYKVLREALKEGDLWVVSFSGGKDSSVLLDITIRYLLELKKNGPKVLVIYSDTLMDWPPIKKWTLAVLESLKVLSSKLSLPLQVKVVKPATGESFLEMVFKRGYPAPSPRFRWCTERLKIRPTLRFIKSIIKNEKQGKVIMLTGIRHEESRERGRYKSKGTKEGPFKIYNRIVAYAPLISWTLNDVWDYIENSEPVWRTPSWKLLIELYGPNRRKESLRFGCILCPLVRRDRSGERIVELGLVDIETYRSLRDWVKLYLLISRGDPNRWREPKRVISKRYKLPYGKLNKEAILILQKKFCEILKKSPSVRLLLKEQIERIADIC